MLSHYSCPHEKLLFSSELVNVYLSTLGKQMQIFQQDLMEALLRK